MTEKETFKLDIAHLYPQLLNIYGDMGNISVLTKRAQWRGIEIEVHDIDADDTIDPSKYDIYFIGGGQDKQQIEVAAQMQKQKSALKQAADSNAVFLAICGGYQLLGHYYQPHDGEKLEGIGLLDSYTTASDKRFIGNVTIESDFLTPRTIVGFENHSGLTFLNGDTKPIAKVRTGNGNNGQDKGEGARFKNVFGTYLHGSLLPKNPHFADYLLELALERKYGRKIELSKLDDYFELCAHHDATDRKY